MHMLIEFIKNFLSNIKLEKITPDLHLRDLIKDSLELLELIMALEDHFNIVISDNEINNIIDIKELYNLIDTKLKQK